MALHAVRDDDPEFTPLGDKAVSASRLTVSARNLEVHGEFDIDQILSLELECRVTSAGHAVKGSSGDLERVHNARVIDVLGVRVIATPEDL